MGGGGKEDAVNDFDIIIFRSISSASRLYEDAIRSNYVNSQLEIVMTISGIANVRRCPHIKRRFNLGYCSKAGPLFQLGNDIPFMFLQTIVLSIFLFVCLFVFFLGGGRGWRPEPLPGYVRAHFRDESPTSKGNSLCQNGKIRPEYHLGNTQRNEALFIKSSVSKRVFLREID